MKAKELRSGSPQHLIKELRSIQFSPPVQRELALTFWHSKIVTSGRKSEGTERDSGIRAKWNPRFQPPLRKAFYDLTISNIYGMFLLKRESIYIYMIHVYT